MIDYRIILLSFLFVLTQSCTTELGSDCTEGTGQIEQRILDLAALTKIDLAMPGNLFVQEGPQLIEIEAPSDIIDKIISDSEIGSEKWTIKLDNCYDGVPINIWVTVPQFLALDISGSGNISTLDTLRNLSSLNLEIQGSGDIDLRLLDAEKLDAEIQGSGNITIKARDIVKHSYDMQGSGNIVSKFRNGTSSRSSIEGSGNIELIGTVDISDIIVEGSGNFFGFELCSSECDIDLQGSGNINVKVVERLNVALEGSGNVCYRGEPIINSDIEGTGNFRSCN